METSTDHGLTVIYDEEAGIISFEWDPETHPEYAYLQDLTEDGLNEMLEKFIDDYTTEKEEKQSSSTEV